MDRRLFLRFRDLVTEEGGTIAEHEAIQRSLGEVWWGWWMRQYEVCPRELLGQVRDEIAQNGSSSGYLFNSGTGTLYECAFVDVRVAPPGTKIGTPDPERTPEYYSRGRYPAWFLLRALNEVAIDACSLVYTAFPTHATEHEELNRLLNTRVASLDQLRRLDATMWVVSGGPSTRGGG